MQCHAFTPKSVFAAFRSQLVWHSQICTKFCHVVTGAIATRKSCHHTGKSTRIRVLKGVRIFLCSLGKHGGHQVDLKYGIRRVCQRDNQLTFSSEREIVKFSSYVLHFTETMTRNNWTKTTRKHSFNDSLVELKLSRILRVKGFGDFRLRVNRLDILLRPFPIRCLDLGNYKVGIAVSGQTK